jgi:hypothetical protein
MLKLEHYPSLFLTEAGYPINQLAIIFEDYHPD